MQIFQSPYATNEVRTRKVRVFTQIWRGRTETKTRIYEHVEHVPACYRYDNKLIMHPALYAQLRNHPDVQDRGVSTLGVAPNLSPARSVFGRRLHDYGLSIQRPSHFIVDAPV